MDSRQRNRADAAASIRDDVVAAIATLGGQFDDRIKELRALKKELSDAQTVSRTLGDANEILSKAKEYEAGVLAKATEYDGKFKTLSENVANQERIINSAMDDLKKREQALADGLHELAGKVAQFDARAATTEQAMLERAKKLEASEAALVMARAEVDGLKRDLNARLDKLRAA